MRDAFIKELSSHAARNKDIFLLTGDLGFSVFEEFARLFPQRFINVGIAEANMMGIAAGLALSGKTALTYSIIPFSVARCLEQIKIDICYHNADVKIIGVGAGYAYGSLGMTHHAIEDIALMRAYPNIRIISPCDGIETQAAVDLALNTKGPFYLRLGKNREPRLHKRQVKLRLGGSHVMRQGGDLVILATGSIVNNALQAADILAKRGIHARVVSMYCLKPIDKNIILESCSKTAVIITVEEHTIIGGLGSAVSEVIAESDIAAVARLKRIGVRDVFSDIVGSHSYLMQRYGLSPEEIAKEILISFRQRMKKAGKKR